jgi:hypothetical protein
MDTEDIGIGVAIILILAFLAYTVWEAYRSRVSAREAAYASRVDAIGYRRDSDAAYAVGDETRTRQLRAQAHEADTFADAYTRRARPLRVHSQEVTARVDRRADA